MHNSGAQVRDNVTSSGAARTAAIPRVAHRGMEAKTSFGVIL